MRTALAGTLFYAAPLLLAFGIAIPNRPAEPVLVAHGRLLPETDEPDQVDLEMTDPDASLEAEETDPVEEIEPAPASEASEEPEGAADLAADGAGAEAAATDAVAEASSGTREARASRPPSDKVLAKPGAPRKGKSKIDCSQPHPNVRVASDGIVEIDRSLVDHYTTDLQTFMTLGFSRPYDENGIKGWYVSGFTCTSPVHKAGFRRGDVLLSVNGKNTRSWVGVFLLYQKLKKQHDFVIELVRKGAPATLQFRVVEDAAAAPS